MVMTYLNANTFFKYSNLFQNEVERFLLIQSLLLKHLIRFRICRRFRRYVSTVEHVRLCLKWVLIIHPTLSYYKEKNSFLGKCRVSLTLSQRVTQYDMLEYLNMPKTYVQCTCKKFETFLQNFLIILK